MSLCPICMPWPLSHLVWKMWLQGSLLAPVTISSRQMMQTLSIACSSSGVASGYLDNMSEHMSGPEPAAK